MFITYRATAGTNIVIATGKAILRKIIFGIDVATSVATFGNDPATTANDVKLKFTGSTLMTANGGDVEVNAIFDKGITMTLSNQTDVTVVWEPIA
jgi:hypothetical protein